MRGDAFTRFVNDLARWLPAKVNWDVLQESVRDLAGIKLTGSLIDTTCWRLAGNIPRLKKSRTAGVWKHQQHVEWVPAQITRVQLRRAGRMGRLLGHEMTFRILAGTPCTLSVYQWWSFKKASHMARFRDDSGSGFGFSRTRSLTADNPAAYPLRDNKEFYSLRCLLKIDPELCDEGPGFKEVGFTTAIAEYNREVHRRRARATADYACPFNFDRADPCYRCPIGQDQCPAAVHEKTFDYKPCKRCKEEDAPHDPVDRVHDYCVNCVEAEILHNKKED